MELAPYHPGLRRPLIRALDRGGAIPAALLEAADGPYAPCLEQPALHAEAAVCLLDAEGPCAAAFALRRPLHGRRARALLFLLPPEARATDRACRLDAALAERLQARGIGQRILFDQPAPAWLPSFRAARGYRELARLTAMAWEEPTVPPAPPPPPDVMVAAYDGGDPETDAEIADFWAGAFAGNRLIAALEPAEVAHFLTHEGSRLVLARESGSGRLVASAEVSPAGYFVSIAVARRYWGRQLAESVGLTAMADLHRRGVRRFDSHVDARNAASLALHRRTGFRPTGTLTAYVSPPTAA